MAQLTWKERELLQRQYTEDYYWHECGKRFDTALQCYIHLVTEKCEALPLNPVIFEKYPAHLRVVR
jgi:hypothetical protein